MNFHQVIKQLTRQDCRYHIDAYDFINSALAYTNKRLNHIGHVSGQELLEGIKQYALEQFGPMTKFVLNYWGIHSCRDFGNIVFNMVNRGLLGKTDHDQIDDFEQGYEFEDAFEKPFTS